MNMGPDKGERIVAGPNEALIKSAAEDGLRLSMIDYLALGEQASLWGSPSLWRLTLIGRGEARS